MDTIYIYTLIFISGICLGSFYNVVALRLLKNESLIHPASHCPKCSHKLNWYELIPIFSYVFLRGKCSKCHEHISLQYPLIELLTGSLFILSYYIFGFSISFVVALIISSILVITYITDFKEYIILDEVIVFSIISLITLKVIDDGVIEGLLAILNGFLLFAFMYVIKFIGDKCFKRESLGGGDIKLSFIIGFILSFKLGLVCLIISSFLAFPYAIIISWLKQTKEVPFGPFLVTSLLIVFIRYEFFNNLLIYLLTR